MLTAVFDTLAIYYGIFAFDQSKLLGLRVILAPLEDFAYPLVATLIVPRLWQIFTPKDEGNVTNN